MVQPLWSRDLDGHCAHCSHFAEVETEFREVMGTPKADDDPARTPWPGPRSGLRFVEAVSEMGLAL